MLRDPRPALVASGPAPTVTSSTPYLGRKEGNSGVGRAPRRFLPAALGCGAALVLFWPLGHYLQWATPRDAPFEYYITIVSLASGAIAGMLVRHCPTPALRIGGTSFVVSFFLILQVWLYIPQVSRRWGPWRDLHRVLVQASRDFDEARRRAGIPDGRLLTGAEATELSARVFNQPLRVDFPLVRRSASVRVLLAKPPYVGVDYGEGRNCAFDLESRREIYCD